MISPIFLHSRRLLLLLILSLGCNQSVPAGVGPPTVPPTSQADLGGDQGPTPQPGGGMPALGALPATVSVAPSPPASPTPLTTLETFFADEGRRLWLSSNHLRVAVDTVWGGAIREIWLNGDNVVSN